jgi:hypothetical protein
MWGRGRLESENGGFSMSGPKKNMDRKCQVGRGNEQKKY